MEITPEIQTRASKIAKEIGIMALEAQAKSPEYPPNTYIHMAIYNKLAELELRLEKLENRPETII